ncbi:MAG: 3-dehydroquinate synthase [Maricaulaceae bacterium]|nr:3-dehydroquinate synthase [Maricaulaceae bacterium]
MTSLRTVTVQAGGGDYDVVIGAGALAACAPRIAALCLRGRAALVTDSTVAGLHMARLEKLLSAAGVRIEPVIIPPGEGQKSFAGLERLTGALLDMGLERGEPVIAFGGGVVGDLAGFAAAIYKRGTRVIQIPTTLLAQADSSVGGKTGINTAQGKNLAGAFHPPALVVADSDLLASLPERDLRAGYAEIVKAALIGDAAEFARLEALGAAALAPETLPRALAAAIAFKAAVVAEDERETGRRALLNLGHTFAHAFEAEAAGRADPPRHGEAVAAGLALAFAYSVRRGVCPAADSARVKAHLAAAGLPDGPKTLPGGPWDAARLAARMTHDKKNAGGAVTLILVRGVGAAYIEPGADMDDLRDFLAGEL